MTSLIRDPNYSYALAHGRPSREHSRLPVAPTDPNDPVYADGRTGEQHTMAWDDFEQMVNMQFDRRADAYRPRRSLASTHQPRLVDGYADPNPTRGRTFILVKR